MADKTKHPNRKTLLAFAAGKLDSVAELQVEDHVTECSNCAEEIERFRSKPQNLDETNTGNISEASFALNQTMHLLDAEPTDTGKTGLENHPKYQLLGEIGAGGMGAVYKAKHKVMGRDVAIKVIHSEFVSNTEAVARFHNEVRAAAMLSHRNIVAAFDAEQIGDTHFLVMEFVAGESLRQTVKRRGKLPVAHSCNYVLQVAHGLKHAHENGMIHRDIKPQNLMKTPKGIIKILDFGLARMDNSDAQDSQLTSTGVMMGTADYIAPEQARSAREADIRSDLYGLGCTFYFLLTGKPPYPLVNRVDKIISHCSMPFPEVADLRDDVPAKVIEILQRLVEKDPANRYQTPQELIDDLAPFGRSAATSSIKPDGDATELQSTELQSTGLLPATSRENTVLAPPVKIAIDTHGKAANEPLKDSIVGEHTAGSNAVEDKSTAQPNVTLTNITTSTEINSRELVSPSGRTSNANESRIRQSLSATQRQWLVACGTGTLVLILCVIVWGEYFGGGRSNAPNNGQTNKTGTSNNQHQENLESGSKSLRENGPVTNGSKRVAVIFGYREFCYGDFGPMADELRRNGIEVITVSTTKQTARYLRSFAGDKTPNKQDVEIDMTINELVEGIDATPISAIVFIGGNGVLNGIADPESVIGQNVSLLISKVKSSGGWISAVGIGMNIPSSLGAFDSAVIVESNWNNQQDRAANLVAAPSHIDQANRIATARDWIASKELGAELAIRIAD